MHKYSVFFSIYTRNKKEQGKTSHQINKILFIWSVDKADTF